MNSAKKEMDHTSTILIVDDEPNIRDVLNSLLKEEGYRLNFAENGLEAYKKARELIPDLILLDVMMPGMDGFEVCRRVRAEPSLAQVPIIMITALGDTKSRINGFASSPRTSVKVSPSNTLGSSPISNCECVTSTVCPSITAVSVTGWLRASLSC